MKLALNGASFHTYVHISSLEVCLEREQEKERQNTQKGSDVLEKTDFNSSTEPSKEYKTATAGTKPDMKIRVI
jgi:hypothetical protein